MSHYPIQLADLQHFRPSGGRRFVVLLFALLLWVQTGLIIHSLGHEPGQLHSSCELCVGGQTLGHAIPSKHVLFTVFTSAIFYPPVIFPQFQGEIVWPWNARAPPTRPL